jgi:hypothetical protein
MSSAAACMHTIFSEGEAVFICYAHADNQSKDPKRRWLDRLLEFLQPLVRQNCLRTWSDEDIKIGDEWHERIRTQLEVSRAILLLISPAFLASDYIATSELPVLLKNASDAGATIVPLIISPCLYEEARFRYPDPKLGPDLLRLSSIQSANPPSRTLIEMSEGEQNRVLLLVARRLLEIALPLDSEASLKDRGAIRQLQDDRGIRVAMKADTARSTDAIRKVLAGCYKRSLFTRTHAQLSLDAMFDSISNCRKLVESETPEVSDPELAQMLADVLGALDGIERIHTFSKPSEPIDVNKIDQLKLQALRNLRLLSRLTNIVYAIPDSRLTEEVFFSKEDADKPPTIE